MVFLVICIDAHLARNLNSFFFGNLAGRELRMVEQRFRRRLS